MRDLLIRLALGSPCIGIAVWMMLQPSASPYHNLLGVFPCLAAFALIVTPSSTSVAASIFQPLFAPHEDAAPRPSIRCAERLRFTGEHDAALAEYERLLREFPNDLKLWNSCFEIAWVQLRSADTANELLRSARGAVPDAGRLAKIQHLESVQRRRFLESG